VFSSLRRRPVIISTRNRPLANSSTTGATIAIVVNPGSVPDPSSAVCSTSSKITDNSTATEAPHRKPMISSRGGSGSQRSSHR
jgi:hypothetical protein